MSVLRDTKFVNTELFSETANFFLKHKRYTYYERGSYPYKEFWDEETRRCKEGYSIAGVMITGRHYAYLNYGQIEMTPADAGKTSKKRKSTKIISFPRFWDTDYLFFWELELAENGDGTDENPGGQHMIVAKARRKGFSFKCGFLCAWQYNFVPKSRAVIGAYLGEYADITMSMARDYLNFFNEHTAWKRNRLPDKPEYVRAAFKETMADGTEIISGYKSEIQSLTFKDNPFKSIGKGVGLFLVDEAGKFPNLKDTWIFTKPTLESGDNTTGLGIIFGTGGDMDAGSVDFADMFYSPEIYGFRAYDNIWDEGAQDKCGYFVPDYSSREGHIDEFGNSSTETAKASEEIKRVAIRKDVAKRHTLTKYLSQFPFTPKEAFLRSTGNMFPIAELSEWLGKLEHSKSAADVMQIGQLNLKTHDSVMWVKNESLIPILNYPLASGDKPDGCITIWEHPTTDNSGRTPDSLYLLGCDPVDQDQADSSPSLGSVFVYKKFINANETYHRIVAEYTGRPSIYNGGVEAFYEIVRRLCIYYNGKCLYENQLKGLKVYFQQKKSLHLLCTQPNIVKDRNIIKDSIVNRGYGIHMSKEIKRQGELYIAQWLVEPVSDLDGQEILRLHTIRSLPLLKELIAYDPFDDKKNFDRVISFMLCLYQNQEDHDILANYHVSTIYDDSFWKKDLFRKSPILS